MDWLRETKPKRVADVGAYLAEAIRKDFAAPAGFKSQAERAEAEATMRARQELEERARQAKAREREERARIVRYWAELTPDEQRRLDAEALADANPETRAAYEGATTPQARRLLLVGLRDALIRAGSACPRWIDRRPAGIAQEARHGVPGGRVDRFPVRGGRGPQGAA